MNTYTYTGLLTDAPPCIADRYVWLSWLTRTRWAAACCVRTSALFVEIAIVVYYYNSTFPYVWILVSLSYRWAAASWRSPPSASDQSLPRYI